MPEMTLEEAMQAAMHLDAPQASTNCIPSLKRRCVSLKATAITMDLS